MERRPEKRIENKEVANPSERQQSMKDPDAVKRGLGRAAIRGATSKK